MKRRNKKIQKSFKLSPECIRLLKSTGSMTEYIEKKAKEDAKNIVIDDVIGVDYNEEKL